MNAISRPPRPRRRPPPSDRDQALYLQYSLSGMTQAQMAAEHGLTQSRVPQIIRRVRSWLAEQQPRDESQPGDDNRQALAQRLEYERLDYLFREAIRNFDRQQPTVTTHREGSFGRTPFSEQTVRELPRAVQWLKVAMRAAETIRRLQLARANSSTCACRQL